MASRTATLTARLIDGISGPAKGASGALKGLGASAGDLKKLGNSSPQIGKLIADLDKLKATQKGIADYRDAGRTWLDLGKRLRATQGEIKQTLTALEEAKRKVASYDGVKSFARGGAIAKEMADARKEVTRLESAYGNLQRDAVSLSASFEKQGQATRGLRAGLLEAGVSLKTLGRSENEIKAAIAGVNAELARQPGLLAAAASRTEALVRANRDLARGMAEAGRRQAESSRVAYGMGAPARAAAEARAAAIREATAAKAERLQASRGMRREALTTIGTGAGLTAAYRGKKIGLEAVQSAADFDIAVRKQKEFTDIGTVDQAGLLAQAKRIGQETQFSNIDVVKAQTAAMQGLPAGFGPELKAAVAQGIVENVRNFATLMETDLKDGSETIRSYLQATGKDISTKEKALAEANKATNQIVKMAKLGGMSGEDAAQFVKYAAASSTSAGLTTDSMMSLGALARRGGLRGDEAGVFMRATASKLVDPTKKGLAAFNAAGINHSSFVKMPERLSTSALEGQFRMDIGKGFTPGIRKRIDAINADKGLIADQGRYTEAVVKAVGDILGKTKKGKVRASDAQTAAKAAGSYYKVAAQSVDTEGLLDALMRANPTLAQLNAILTGKHGGKGAITQRQWDEFKAGREEIGKAGDDPDYAAKKAKEVMAGLGGAVENLKGSWENFILTVGTANEGLIRFTADGLGNMIDGFSKLDKTTQQALSIGAGGAALAGGAYGAFNLAKALLGFGGSSVALNGSAAALSASAAALDAAALKLAGGGVGSGVGAAGGAAAGGAAASGVSIGLGGSIVAGGAIGGAVADALTPGTTAGITGLITGAESSLQQTMRALAAERAANAGLKDYSPLSIAGGRRMTMPGAEAGTGFTSQYDVSRGAVGDFLFGKDKKNIILPTAPTTPKIEASQIGRVEVAEQPTEAPLAPPTPKMRRVPLPPRRPAGLAGADITLPEIEVEAPSQTAPREPGQRKARPAPAPDAGKIAQATAALAAYKTELAAVKAQAAEIEATGNFDLSPALGPLATRAAEIERAIADVQAKIQALSSEVVAPRADTSGLAPLGTEADAAKDKLAALDGMSVAPTVNAGSITEANSRVLELLANLARVGSAASSAQAAVAGLAGQARTAAASVSAAGRTGAVASAVQNSRTDRA